MAGVRAWRCGRPRIVRHEPLPGRLPTPLTSVASPAARAERTRRRGMPMPLHFKTFLRIYGFEGEPGGRRGWTRASPNQNVAGSLTPLASQKSGPLTAPRTSPGRKNAPGGNRKPSPKGSHLFRVHGKQAGTTPITNVKFK